MAIAVAAALLSAAPAPPPPATIIDFDQTMAGQPLVVPPSPLRVVATRIVLPAGATIGTHRRLWPAPAIVERAC